MKKEDRIKRQQDFIRKLNAAVMFETMTTTSYQVSGTQKAEIDNETKKAIVKYKKAQDSKATRKGVENV